MQPNIMIHFKPDVEETTVREAQTRWGLKPAAIRKGPAGTNGAVVTYEYDPLSPLAPAVPEIMPALVEKVTARIPFYEDVDAGDYLSKTVCARGTVRRTAENGVILNLFECSNLDARRIVLLYEEILTGEATLVKKYGVRQAEEVR